MALSIGELVGYLRIDDSGVDDGLSRAQRRVEGFKKAAGALGAAAGAAAGAGLSSALAAAAEFDSARVKLEQQFGEGTAMAQKAGEAAGNLFAAGYSSSMEEVSMVTASVGRDIHAMWGASTQEIEVVSGKVMSLSKVFDQDFNAVIRATDQLIVTGLAPNAEAALDLIARGFQAGINDADDLLDTISEYSTQFRKLGLDGQAAFGLISQGLRAGARDADTVADALKEFSIRAIDGSKSTIEAYQALGLNAEQMMGKIGKGGKDASEGLQTVLDRLRAMKDPVEREAAAVGLFGTKAEDLGAALYALDPSKAVEALGQVEGAATRLDEAMRERAEQRVLSMQNGLKQFGAELVSLPGPLGDVAAAVGAFGPSGIAMAGSLSMIGMFVGPLIGRLVGLAGTAISASASFVASMGRMAAAGTRAVVGAIADLGRWAVQVAVQGARAVASMTVTATRYVAQWTLMAVRSLAQAAVMAGAWLVGVITPALQALGRMAIVAATYVAQWVIMAAGAMARAAIMAASWLIAMGPVGWVIALVVGLVALIIANWDTVKEWTVKAWEAVSGAVSAAWNWIVGLVTNAVSSVVDFVRNCWDTAVNLARNAWDWIVNVVSDGIDEVLSFVRDLPGNILGALGDLGSLLVNAGKDLIRGLWDGIVGMGRWLWDNIMNWVRTYVPGPILQFLGIASPSKLMRDEVGRWIPAGIGEGIIANAAAAADAAREMAAEAATGAREGALGSLGMSSASAYAGAATGAGVAPAGSDGVSAEQIAAAVGSAVHAALDGARMEVDGRGVARLVNRSNLLDRRRSITAVI